MIKIRFAQTLALAALLGCQAKTEPAGYLNQQEQAHLVRRLAPYIAPPPEGVTGAQRLTPAFKDYFDAQAKTLSLKGLVVDNDTARFLLYRPAPSNENKLIAVAGKAYPAKGTDDFGSYEEAFWTWKMKPEELDKKASKLFDKYLEGEDLEPYMNSSGVDYWIEFPSEDTRFNVSTRTWSSGYAVF
jgi:hypothetical protein